jgi:hypothetical protein
MSHFLITTYSKIVRPEENTKFSDSVSCKRFLQTDATIPPTQSPSVGRRRCRRRCDAAAATPLPPTPLPPTPTTPTLPPTLPTLPPTLPTLPLWVVAVAVGRGSRRRRVRWVGRVVVAAAAAPAAAPSFVVGVVVALVVRRS